MSIICLNKSPTSSTRSVPASILPFVTRLINVNLDFTQGPVLDFPSLPTLPTGNASLFEIQSDNEGWFFGAKSELSEFFMARRTSFDWLHRGGAYDALLFLIGIPLGIWVVIHLTPTVATRNFPTIISYSIYVYAFLATLGLFRMFFSYSRWCFRRLSLKRFVTRRFGNALFGVRSYWLF